MRRTVWAVLMLLCCATGVEAQADVAEEAYFQAVADFFDVSAAEIGILRERGLPDDELAVVLFVARRAGVSVEALAALRRAGQDWSVLLQRYGVGADALHVPIPDDGDAGRLAGAYERYRSTTPGGWSSLALANDDIVTLVNVRLLSETLGLAPAEVLRRAGPEGPFSSRFRAFMR